MFWSWTLTTLRTHHINKTPPSSTILKCKQNDQEQKSKHTPTDDSTVSCFLDFQYKYEPDVFEDNSSGQESVAPGDLKTCKNFPVVVGVAD